MTRSGKIITFTIKLTPVSKKNHQRIVTNKKTGIPFIIPSSQYKQYEKDAAWFIPKTKSIDYPVNVKCLFYMPTRRRTEITITPIEEDDISNAYPR